MPAAKIIMIGSEPEEAKLIVARLGDEGYEVKDVFDGEEGLEQVRTFLPDLVILNQISADVAAVQVIKRLRKSSRTAQTPILLISVYDKTSDAIVGLDDDANDFIVKPVNLAELTARVASLLRRFKRHRKNEENTYQIGPIYINMDRHEVAIDGEPLKLTLTEFRLLSTLAEAGGRVLKRNLLIDQAIGMDAIVMDRTIDVHLTALRRKLGRARSCLKTIRGVGYRLAADA